MSERDRARMLFKKLKAGLIEWEDMTEDEIECVLKRYRWIGR